MPLMVLPNPGEGFAVWACDPRVPQGGLLAIYALENGPGTPELVASLDAHCGRRRH